MDSHELKLTLAKVEDAVTGVINKQNQGMTSFLDPTTQKKVERYLKGIRDVIYIKFGGYPLSERNLFVFYPDWMQMDDSPLPLCGISIEWNDRYYKIGHRDILGSILGLGIKREKVGDIIINSNKCQVVVMNDISPYILSNLIMVGNAPVSVSRIDLEDIKIPELKVKSIRATIPSMRLDCIASSGFGISRNKILPHIRGGKIFVNWELTLRPDFQTRAGDLITMRGMGKIKIKEIIGITKKNKIAIIIEKYI